MSAQARHAVTHFAVSTFFLPPTAVSPSVPESANIARHLGRRAAQQPTTPALKIPRGRDRSGAIDYLTLSFAELDGEVAAWVEQLQRYGVKPGDRVLVMVRQGLPLIAAAFALFSYGAIPIVIDPGMGLKSFLSCVERSRPRALLGIPLARLLSRVFRRPFRTVELRVPASGNPLARLTTQANAHPAPRATSPATEPIFRSAIDLAAIVFTSGSTGAPKGVCYEHGMFEAQVRLIQTTYDIQPGEIDLPMLPIFARRSSRVSPSNWWRSTPPWSRRATCTWTKSGKA